MAERIYNFSAGPAVLPESVLRDAQRDIWNIADSGIGIMEHSHRSAVFDRVLEEAEADCRTLAAIPDNYRVLFLQGGASTQFLMVAANFLAENRTADYLNTGAWAAKAIKEAGFYGNVHVAATSEDENFSYIPPVESVVLSDSPAYVHYTSNNTIFGTQFDYVPECPDGSFLVCDMSSDIFSRPIDVSRYGLIYAGAQKNLGPSGVTLVIIRDDLPGQTVRPLPTMLSYETHVTAGSRFNTPPAFGVYIVGQVFKWIIAQDGLKTMAERNSEKASVLYDTIDHSSFFRGTARENSRSTMNVCFRAPSAELEKKFIADASARGFSGLKGHRSVGGMRASIYNAFPAAGCEALAEFMREFEAANG
ncbi:MAG: 3-phosphoserine/phosphohydroxythreonine transaminase [Planctomycetes bacterium]|nr:3-phosphoserine/phosphohydroxythreonine transaminase [Planctomycetota bacterium]